METHFFIKWRSKNNIKNSFRETKKFLPDLISSQQTTYVKNRHIGESGRLISVIQIAKIKKLDGFLVAMDIEKAIDSFDYDFLVLTLEKYGFGKNFILWVKILLGDQCYNYKIFFTWERSSSR